MPNGIINLEDCLYQSGTSDEQSVEIRNQLLSITETFAWKQVQTVVSIKQKRLELQKQRSDNPNEVMSCDKQLQGINFVLSTIDELIKDGEQAALKLEHGDVG